MTPLKANKVIFKATEATELKFFKLENELK